jgi:hypothetical protein
LFVNDRVILDSVEEQRLLVEALNHYSQLKKVHKCDLKRDLVVNDSDNGIRDYTYNGDVVLRVGKEK